jgi:uncharacterized protein DUF3592
MMFMAVLAVVAGALCIAAAIRIVYRQLLLNRHGASAVGRVYRLDEEFQTDGSLYTPLIAFRDEGGVEHKFRSSLSSNRIRHPLGSEVPLRYLRAQPEVVDIDTWSHRLISFVVSFGVGSACLFFAAAHLFSSE